jgi:hypothetical protein
MHVTFSARAQRASASRLPVVELLDVVNSRVDRSRVYISDTAALFRLKPGSMPAFRAGLCISAEHGDIATEA